MRYLSASLAGLLLGAAALTATAAPTPNTPANPTTPTNPNGMNNPPGAPINPNNPPISMPPSGTTHCPPSSMHRSRAPGSATSNRMPRTPMTPAPGQSTGMPPCR